MTVRRTPSVDLQKAREGQRITRSVLATKTGLSSGYLKVIEKRKSTPSPDALKKITSALNLPFDKFFKEYRPGEPVPEVIVPRKPRKKREGASVEGAVTPPVAMQVSKARRAPEQQKHLEVLASECRAAADDSIRALFAWQSGADVDSTRTSLRSVVRHLLGAFTSTLEFDETLSPELS